MKKKNLLKCLALTSMLALSVGAVTSCGTQGEAGKDGAQGAQGATGAKGEQGEKGDDGKTYLEVIVVPGVVTGGTIEQDKYYVQAGESFTLTFKDSDGKTPEVVFDFTINGAVISVDPGSASYTYTATSSDTGFQITSATFGTVKDYAMVQIYSEVMKLWSTDKQLYLDQDVVADDYDNATNFIASDYYLGSKDVWDAATEAISDAQDDIDALDDDATIAEKVESANKGIEAGVKAVDAAYVTYLAAAKKTALENVTKLDKGFDGNDAFASADRTSILASAQKAIEDAKTLEELSASVNSVNKKDSAVLIGSYNELYRTKEMAFKNIKDALGSITDTMFKKDNEEELAQIKAQLKNYDIPVDSLPTEVAATWNSKISSATSLEVYAKDAASTSTDTYSEGDPVFGYEGAKAITESYTALKTKLKAAILKQYTDEIDGAKALTTTDSKTTLKGVVDGALNDWIKANDDGYLTANIKSYFDASTVYGSDDATKFGLISYIEYKLGLTVTANYRAFGQERLATAQAAAIAQFKAEIAACEKDSTYAGSFAYKQAKTTGGFTKDSYYIQYKLGTKTTSPAVDSQIVNPFYSSLSTTLIKDADNKDTNYVINTSAVAKDPAYNAFTSADSLFGVLAVNTYDVEDLYKSVVDVDATTGKIKTTANTLGAAIDVLSVKRAASVMTGKFTALYQKAVEVYHDAQVASVIPVTFYFKAGNKYLTNDANGNVIATKYFNSLLPLDEAKAVDYEKTSFSDISSAAYQMKSAQSLFDRVDADLVDWVDGKVDPNMVDATGLLKNNEVYKAVLDATNASSIVSKVLDGTLKTNAAIDEAMKGMDDIYESSVSTYLSNAKEQLESAYNIAIKSAATSLVPSIKEAYQKMLDAIGTGVIVTWTAKDEETVAGLTTAVKGTIVTPCDSYTSIDVWYKLSTDLISSLALGGTAVFAKYVAVPEVTGSLTSTAGKAVLTKVNGNAYEYSLKMSGLANNDTYTFKIADLDSESYVSGTAETATINATTGVMTMVAATGSTDITITIATGVTIVVHVVAA